MFWTWTGFGGLCYSRVSWRLCMSRTSALMCRLASLVYRCAQTLNTHVRNVVQITHRSCLIRVCVRVRVDIGGRGGHKWLFIPPLASRLMSLGSVEHAGSLTGRQSAPFFWPETEALSLMYPGMTQSMQGKKTKPVSSASTAAHLCSCLQRVPVFRVVFDDVPLGPSTSRKEPTNKRACCWGRTCRTRTSTLKMTDVVAPVARLGYVNCPSVGAKQPLCLVVI